MQNLEVGTLRGLNVVARRQTVREMAMDTSCSILYLQGTKLAVLNSSLVNEIAGGRMQGMVYKSANGTRGIMILWDENLVQIESPIVLDNPITTRITTVYGPHEDQHKPTFIEEIKHIYSMINEPWLILGDFNMIYQTCDKNNLNLNRRLMGQFGAAINHCELKKIHLQDRRFTWSNEQANPTLEWIDRAFGNPGCMGYSFLGPSTTTFIILGLRPLPSLGLG